MFWSHKSLSRRVIRKLKQLGTKFWSGKKKLGAFVWQQWNLLSSACRTSAYLTLTHLGTSNFPPNYLMQNCFNAAPKNSHISTLVLFRQGIICEKHMYTILWRNEKKLCLSYEVYLLIQLKFKVMIPCAKASRPPLEFMIHFHKLCNVL